MTQNKRIAEELVFCEVSSYMIKTMVLLYTLILEGCSVSVLFLPQIKQYFGLYICLFAELHYTLA